MVKVTLKSSKAKQIETAYTRALYETALYYVELVKATMKREDGIDTGELVKSIFVRKVGDGTTVQVGSQAVQSVIMEFGRRPLQKRPPMSSLTGRAKRKGIVGSDRLETMTNEEKGIIYVIAKSIGEKGIEKREYFQRTYRDNIDQINQYFVQKFTLYMQ